MNPPSPPTPSFSWPSLIPFTHRGWQSLPSSISTPWERNDRGLHFRARGGDWRATPNEFKIDGPTWGVWRQVGGEVEVTARIDMGDYRDYDSGVLTDDTAGLMIYVHPRKWIKLDLVAKLEDHPHYPFGRGIHAMVTRCDGPGAAWTRQVEVFLHAHSSIPQQVRISNPGAITVELFCSQDKIIAEVNEVTISESFGIGHLERIWVGFVAGSPRGGPGANAVYEALWVYDGLLGYYLAGTNRRENMRRLGV